MQKLLSFICCPFRLSDIQALGTQSDRLDECSRSRFFIASASGPSSAHVRSRLIVAWEAAENMLLSVPSRSLPLQQLLPNYVANVVHSGW